MRHMDGTACAGDRCAFKNNGNHAARPYPPYGLGTAVPDDAKAAWGARLNVTQDGYVDILWDRQGADGPDQERPRLLDLLADRVPMWWLSDTIASLLREGDMQTREAEDFVLYMDDELIVVANTNASAGYCYVAAWIV